MHRHASLRDCSESRRCLQNNLSKTIKTATRTNHTRVTKVPQIYIYTHKQDLGTCNKKNTIISWHKSQIVGFDLLLRCHKQASNPCPNKLERVSFHQAKRKRLLWFRTEAHHRQQPMTPTWTVCWTLTAQKRPVPVCCALSSWPQVEEFFFGSWRNYAKAILSLNPRNITFK